MKKRWYRETEEIENKAWAVLQEFSRQFRQVGEAAPEMPPVPVQDIAQLLAGLDLEAVSGLQHQGQRLSGFLEPDIRLISYELADILPRQFFSIAHELGHYYLHYLPRAERQALPTLFPLEEVVEVNMYYRCSVEDIDLKQKDNNENIGGVDQTNMLQALRIEQKRAREEIQANLFAAALLMPVPYVEELVRAGHGSPRALADRLGVSPLAAEVRLVRMGYRDVLDRNRQPDDPTQRTFT